MIPLAVPLLPAIHPSLQEVAERAVRAETGHVYLRSREPLTLYEADELARAAGGALLALDSAAEETFVLDNFGAAEGYWIGLEFPRERWSSGEPIPFSHWFRGEPSGGVHEPFTVLNWGEPGGWGDVAGDAETDRYRALLEFEAGRAPAALPELPPRPSNHGVLLLAVQDLTLKDLENARLPHLNELWTRSAWSADAAADASGDPLASLGMLVWGVGKAKSRLSLAKPKDAAVQLHESLLPRCERALARLSTAALLDDQAASGILMDGRIDLRVANASARKGGSAQAVAEALALPAPLAVVATWTSFAVAGAEPAPAPEAQRAKELTAIDQELGVLLAALRARPDFAAEDWWIALAGLVPPAGKAGARKTSPEDPRARSGVPLCLVTNARGPGELLGELALVDLVPTALAHLGLAPRRSFGLDGRVLVLDRSPEFGADLVENGGAELQFGYASSDQAHVTGWRQLGGFTAAPHATLAGDPGSDARGQTLLRGSSGARLEQTIDLTALAAEIDRGVVRFELSVLLGLGKDSTATIELGLACLNERKKSLEEHALALPEPPRKDQGLRRAGWTPLTLEGRLPRRTRAVRLALSATGPETLADEVRLVLARD